ncbi:MAG: DEAD/DEAH box helicase [Deltaproteobacteria bacterium]|nr:DEAD/DEAH box helicase [Deltaproteobacteria bacterium]
MIRITFHAGTLEIRGLDDPASLPKPVEWDIRSASHRCPALYYPDVVMSLVRRRVPYQDDARRYEVLDGGITAPRPPRPYQQEALDAWLPRRQGVVVLPTGAGKTYLAMMAIEAVARSALVVVPTLELVRQWYQALAEGFSHPVGAIGGGDYNPQPLTVITYDSAYNHMEHLGDRYGLVIFDECHHLPSDTYSLAARSCLAPYRLGLSATPERADGRHLALDDLIGPVVYRRDVVELAGDYLADYSTHQVVIELTEEERADYLRERAIYKDFIVSQGIRLSSPSGWSEFVMKSARSAQGRRAMRAFLRQKQLAFAAPSKLAMVERLLHQHRRDKTLLFTQNNDTAYEVAQRFLVPVITHQTKPSERVEVLEGFSAGRYRAVVTSKVLNEGVDVPDANVAIVISGSGSVREHVQRLGRILRRGDDKQAVLYELIAADTSEAYTSARRREHNAYR